MAYGNPSDNESGVSPADVTHQVIAKWLPSDGRPLIIDIGCGKGRHLRARAAANPDAWFIGIDRLRGRLHRLARRAGRDGIRNLHLWHCDAGDALLYFLPPCTVHACTLFFPDPWPKRRHHRRRLVSTVFLESLRTRLIPGGIIDIATDHAGYFRSITEQFAAHAVFRQIPAHIMAPDQQTDFECLFNGQQQPIYRCAYRTVDRISGSLKRDPLFLCRRGG